MTQRQVELAEIVAREIHGAIGSHNGSQQKATSTIEEQVRFEIFAPTLEGQSLINLWDGETSFSTRVSSVKSEEVGENGLPRTLLGDFFFELEAEGDTLTGVVTVYERPSRH